MNTEVYPMQSVAPTVAAVLGLPSPSSALEPPVTPILDDLAGVERVAVLAVDALGLAILRHWRDRMPFIAGLTERRMRVLRSILPSITPVNFGCMVTGADLATHGARTYGHNFTCETLFDVFRSVGKTSGGFGRSGYTGNELLGRHADISARGEAVSDLDVEKAMLSAAQSRRPDFIIVQYAGTDDAFHATGPYSQRAGDAAELADEWAGRCVAALTAQGYGIILLADHGHHDSEREDGSPGGGHGTDSDEDCLVPVTWLR